MIESKSSRKMFFGVTSILSLLPIVYSVIMLKDLPDSIPVHWNIYGEVDGYLNGYIVAIGLPIFFFAINSIILFVVNKDSSNMNQVNIVKKISSIILVIASNVIVPSLLFYSSGYSLNLVSIVMLIVSSIFLIIGNYLPKIRPNYSIGIRIPWTLKNQSNWKKTHHFAGVLWMCTGCLLLIFNIAMYIANKSDIMKIIVTLIILVIICILPIFYSFSLDKKLNK